MKSSDVARAITAATSVAASLGLPATGAVVLHHSNKVALRLTPCDVLARVSHADRGVAHVELERARQLARAGCRVGVPEPRVEAKVYTVDGFAVTLWAYYEPVTAEFSPAAYAGALQQLHSGMRDVEIPSPHYGDRIADAEQVVAEPDLSPELTTPDRALLGNRLARLREALNSHGADEQLLHGEPHPGNVLATTTGARFIDFETICRGPVEFDLAHVPASVCDEYPHIDLGLLHDCRQLVLAMVAAWRWRVDDEFPDGRQWGRELLHALRAGPPWPTLDAMTIRLETPPDPGERARTTPPASRQPQHGDRGLR